MAFLPLACQKTYTVAPLPVPTATPVPPTLTPTLTRTFTASPTITNTPTVTFTPTATATATYWFAYTPCAVTFTMGNTATTPLGYMWQDDICGVEGQAANYAKLTAIVVDEYSAAGSVMGAFYGCDTTNNVPTTLITQTGPMPAAYGWVTMAVTPPVVVNPGTYYLVAISSSYSVMATSGNGYTDWRYLYTYSGIAGTGFPNSLVAPANNAYNNSYLASSLMIQGLWTCP